MYPHHPRYFADLDGKMIFHLTSESLKEDIAFAIENQIKSINLNSRMGFKFTNIKCVVESIPLIEELWVGEGLNLDGLEILEELRLLKINSSQKIDFSKFSKLEYLDFKFDKKMKGFENLINLKFLYVDKGDTYLFSHSNFESKNQLESLVVIQSKINDFSFLGSKKELKNLEVYYCRSEIDFKHLDTILPNVEVIKISNCKANKNINEIDFLKSLKHFAIVDSGPLENCFFVEKMPNLKNLIVLGKSYFEDGELSLLEKKNLEHCAFDNKKHYTHKSTYSNEKLKSFISKR